MDLSRRQLLGAAGALSLPAVLAACGGFSTSGVQPPGRPAATATPSPSRPGAPTPSWPGFKSAIDGFQKANAGTTVTLNAVPYSQMFTNIDAQLQAGNPPDIFRVPYYTFGSYAGRGQLLDLSGQLPSGFSDRFTSAAWAAVQNKSKPFGVPHHTDTSVILYNKTALDSYGITSVPTTLDQAWTWEQFEQVLLQLRSKLPADKFPYVANWQGNGVTRWLTWLFENNGRFLAEDLKAPAISSDAGKAAVDFTKSFFARQLVPPNSSVKSTTLAADIWYSQTAVMSSGGAFQIPDATKNLKFEWGATFSPEEAALGERLRRQRPGGHGRDEEAPAGGRVPRLRDPDRADALVLRHVVAAADPQGPRLGGHHVRRPPRALPGLHRPGLLRAAG